MRMIPVILALWCANGFAQISAEDLPEMCAAAYIVAEREEALSLWKGLFPLRSDVLAEYLQTLRQYEEADDLPAELLALAVAECDAVYDATSQASVVDGN